MPNFVAQPLALARRQFRCIDRPVLAIVTMLAVSQLSSGCKVAPGGDDGQAPGVVTARQSGAPQFYAADRATIQRDGQLYFQTWNQTFTLHFDDLSQSVQLPDSRTPFSGSYYAELDGGTDQVVVGGRSPLQKYDEAFGGGQGKASAWERQNHTSTVDWAGHCNGFAAASSRYPTEPSRNVVRGTVTFAPQDIKALMAEVHMNADYEFLGGNRCDNPTLGTPAGRVDPTLMGDCEGINPGTLHAALGNWIGRMKHAVIANTYPGNQVWNHPLYRFQILQTQPISKEDAANSVSWKGQGYVFNPAAARLVFVSARVSFIETPRREVLGQRISRDIDLNYILELDANGDIMGGEWADAKSQANHPEFLWVAFSPTQPNGTRYMGNPYVDAAEVLRLYAESVGLDPNKLPPDIVRPASGGNWGQGGNFDVTLDGTTSGAAFAGKPLLLKITRRQGLAAAGLSLEVQVNGAAQPTVTTTGAEPISMKISPSPGLSLLNITWKKGDQVLESQTLNFHVLR